MSALPSSLTVLRPISFTGSMRGPDGRSSSGPGDDALDPEVRMHAASMPNAPSSPASGGHGEGSPATAASSALSPSGSSLPISQPVASSPKVDRPSDRQRRSNDAAVKEGNAPAATAAAASSPATAAAAASPSALDGVAVDIDMAAAGYDDDEEVGFSAAELAGGHASHHHHQHHDHQQHHHHHRNDSEEKNVHFADDSQHPQPRHHQPRLTVDPPRNTTGYPTPPINTRTVLLHADHTEDDAHPPAQAPLSIDFESSLPRDSTVPPMARQKLESFDELKRKVRHKVKFVELLAACTFVMGVTCVGVGAASLETLVLYPTLPPATMAAGLLMVLFAPGVFLGARRFKDRELRALYMVAGALLAFLLILGIVTASKTEDSIRADVQQRWDFSGGGAVDGYSDAFKSKWGSAENLVETAWRHLTDLVIVQFISVAVMLFLGLLIVRLSQRVQRHLALVALATESKSESNSKAHKRAAEVAAYKAKLAAGDRNADRDLQQERIPEDVKAKKYAASAAGLASISTPGTKSRKLGATPKTEGRSLATPKDGGGAGGKTPKGAKTPKASSVDAAAEQKDPDRVEKLTKSPKTPKRSVDGSGAGTGAGTTLAEKKERKQRKKEKREKESAALKAQRKAGAGGDGAATSRDVMPVVEMESSDSEREGDEKV